MTIVVPPGQDIVAGADITSRRPDVPVVEPADGDATVDALATDESVALLCSPSVWDERFLQAMDGGDWVATMGAGYAAYPTDRLGDRGIVLTNTPGIGAPPVADHVFGLVLSVTRRLPAYYDQQRRRVWESNAAGATDLSGDVCCVLGLGNVGEAVARRAAAFGMTVRGVKRDVAEYDGHADEVYTPDARHAALADARLVVAALPLSEATRGVLGESELDACSTDAIVVNVGRGPVVDTDALLAALSADQVRAACLDVFDEEPLPESSPLWDREDVLVTPHAAWITDKYTDRLLDVFLPQYDRWRAGEPLEHRIV